MIHFDTSWTPLAKRYSLLLYREVGWEDNQSRGVPVLFIPGNAGSAHQIRSIASSAARQYYTSPYTSSPEFSSRAIQPLDIFAVHYNEDLSAFHGPTLDAETAYASSAISYILSLYPPRHVNHRNGPFDGRHRRNIPSTLPEHLSSHHHVDSPPAPPSALRPLHRSYLQKQQGRARSFQPANTITVRRRSGPHGPIRVVYPTRSCGVGRVSTTVFSSALEGCWTGVVHQVVVWCHQVRWRDARAMLELGVSSTSVESGAILACWLRDGHLYLPALVPCASPFEPDRLHRPPSRTLCPAAFTRTKRRLPCASPRDGFIDEVRGLCIRRLGSFCGTLPFFLAVHVFLYMLIYGR
ncbi:PGAP1-like protein-domain-containing protein [Lactarius quietus]|nr:PGAP1-like protein-domain-containing protein [Lactarius quietus]